MNTRLASYQPQFFPRLHYFARFLNADIFMIADYVQFVRKHAYCKQDGATLRGPSYQAHTPIKTKDGLLLMDFPTRHEGLRPINMTKLAFEKPLDRSRGLRLLMQHYHTAPQYERLIAPLEIFFQEDYGSVADINIASILWSLATLFELPQATYGAINLHDVQKTLPRGEFRLKQIVLFSESGIEPPNKNTARDANDWLIETCRVFDAMEYYFGGTSAEAYMNFKMFEDADVALIQQKWECKPYPQLWGEFMPNLSILDLLMHVSPAEAREMLCTQNQ